MCYLLRIKCAPKFGGTHAGNGILYTTFEESCIPTSTRGQTKHYSASMSRQKDKDWVAETGEMVAGGVEVNSHATPSRKSVLACKLRKRKSSRKKSATTATCWARLKPSDGRPRTSIMLSIMMTAVARGQAVCQADKVGSCGGLIHGHANVRDYINQ